MSLYLNCFDIVFDQLRWISVPTFPQRKSASDFWISFPKNLEGNWKLDSGFAPHYGLGVPVKVPFYSTVVLDNLPVSEIGFYHEHVIYITLLASFWGAERLLADWWMLWVGLPKIGTWFVTNSGMDFGYNINVAWRLIRILPQILKYLEPLPSPHLYWEWLILFKASHHRYLSSSHHHSIYLLVSL